MTGRGQDGTTEGRTMTCDIDMHRQLMDGTGDDCMGGHNTVNQLLMTLMQSV